VNTVSVPADAVLRVYDDGGSLAVTEGQDIRAVAWRGGRIRAGTVGTQLNLPQALDLFAEHRP
ncbi:MAG: hypothetical protein EBR82_70475, partial [Caulobacteraceae bacterium]|nr:hypothetical protein [Caulobacteraceae bacterium]